MKTRILVLTLVCFMATVGLAATAFAAYDGVAVESSTVALVSLAREYRKAAESERPTILSQLMDVAHKRRLLLAQAADKDPNTVFKVAMPSGVRHSLPAEAQAEIEEHVDLEGMLQVITKDKDGICTTGYYLNSNGRSFKLRFTSSPPALTSGTKVKARGVSVAGGTTESLLVVNPSLSENLLILGASGTTTTTSGGVVIPPNTFGEQKVLLFLVNFPGNLAQPWTIEQARTLMFGTPNDFYQQNSSGQTWLSGDVAGWFTIPVDVTAATPGLISYYARQAAVNAGINLSAYSHYVYAFPSIGGKIGNQGSVGGTPSESWLEGTLGVPHLVIHELGHNLGLAHSHNLDCGTLALGTSCTPEEYGDVLDVMADTSFGHFTAFQKQRLGWLDYGSSPLVTHVTSTGTYGIEPYASPGSGAKALQIPRGVDPVSGKPVYFYVESRQAIGTDSWLTGSFYASFLSGLAVHIGTEGDYNSSYLLDMTPQSQSTDWNDGALAVGKSFTDPASGVTITAAAVGATGASVGVSFGQPLCVVANPSLSISPTQGPWVGPGTPVKFTVTVVNADSSACTNTVFDLGVALPAGWSGSFSPSSLTLPPGGSAATTLTVTSSASAADGFYPVAVTATNSAVTTRSATLSATYVVNAASANHAPVAVADSAITAVSTPVVIRVLGNDSDPDGDLLSVVSVTQGANGTAAINADGSVTYTPARRFQGSDQFSYTVSDGRGGSATALVSVTVGSTTTVKTGGKH